MDGLSRLAGVGPTIVLGGERLTTTGRTLRHYAEIEAEIIRERGNPFAALRDTLPSGSRRKQVAAIAFEDFKEWPYVSAECISEWLQTWRGIVFQTWQAVRENDRSRWTHKAVSDAMLSGVEAGGREFSTAIVEAIQQASGEDELSRLALWRAPMFVSGDDDSDGIEWKRIFRYLTGEPYRLSHSQILDMPLAAVSMYLMSDAEATRSFDNTKYSTVQYAEQRQRFNEEIIERLAG